MTITPIASPVWMAPLWKPERAFCLSRVQAVIGPGAIPGTGPITVQVVIAEDPEQHVGAGYLTVAEVVIDPDVSRTAVAEVEWPFGAQMLPAGWWVGACHDNDAAYTNPDEVEATMTLTLHGTNL